MTSEAAGKAKGRDAKAKEEVGIREAKEQIEPVMTQKMEMDGEGENGTPGRA